MFKFKSTIFLLSAVSIINFPLSIYANTSSETTTQYVKGSTITADVKSRLLADSEVSSLHITVKTTKSVVTLSGCTKTQGQIDKAENIAKEVKGVTSVKNQLKTCSKK